MKKAEIKIEVVGDSRITAIDSNISGEIGALMLGLTNAIKEIETKVPEEYRAAFRTQILKMLNNRD